MINKIIQSQVFPDEIFLFSSAVSLPMKKKSEIVFFMKGESYIEVLKEEEIRKKKVVI